MIGKAPSEIGDITGGGAFPSQGYVDTCAIRCEGYILECFTGDKVDENALVEEAKERGLYTPGTTEAPGGTPLEAVGELLYSHGIPTNSWIHANVYNLTAELAQGHKVILGIDSHVVHPEHSILSEIQTVADFGEADHAVIVSGIDTTDPDRATVIVSDPLTGEAAAHYPMDQFLYAWSTSEFFMVATKEPAPAWLPEMKNFDYETGHVPIVAGMPYDEFLQMEDTPGALAAHLEQIVAAHHETGGDSLHSAAEFGSGHGIGSDGHSHDAHHHHGDPGHVADTGGHSPGVHHPPGGHSASSDGHPHNIHHPPGGPGHGPRSGDHLQDVPHPHGEIGHGMAPGDHGHGVLHAEPGLGADLGNWVVRGDGGRGHGAGSGDPAHGAPHPQGEPEHGADSGGHWFDVHGEEGEPGHVAGSGGRWLDAHGEHRGFGHGEGSGDNHWGVHDPTIDDPAGIRHALDSHDPLPPHDPLDMHLELGEGSLGGDHLSDAHDGRPADDLPV